MINVLKKGLKFLKKRVASRKEQLEADLKAGNFISAEDEARWRLIEEWLDGAGNMIDEERVAEVLDNKSDYAKSTIEKYVAAMDYPFAL